MHSPMLGVVVVAVVVGGWWGGAGLAVRGVSGPVSTRANKLDKVEKKRGGKTRKK